MTKVKNQEKKIVSKVERLSKETAGNIEDLKNEMSEFDGLLGSSESKSSNKKQRYEEENKGLLPPIKLHQTIDLDDNDYRKPKQERLPKVEGRKEESIEEKESKIFSLDPIQNTKDAWKEVAAKITQKINDGTLPKGIGNRVAEEKKQAFQILSNHYALTEIKKDSPDKTEISEREIKIKLANLKFQPTDKKDYNNACGEEAVKKFISDRVKEQFSQKIVLNKDKLGERNIIDEEGKTSKLSEYLEAKYNSGKTKEKPESAMQRLVNKGAKESYVELTMAMRDLAEITGEVPQINVPDVKAKSPNIKLSLTPNGSLSYQKMGMDQAYKPYALVSETNDLYFAAMVANLDRVKEQIEEIRREALKLSIQGLEKKIAEDLGFDYDKDIKPRCYNDKNAHLSDHLIIKGIYDQLLKVTPGNEKEKLASLNNDADLSNKIKEALKKGALSAPIEWMLKEKKIEASQENIENLAKALVNQESKKSNSEIVSNIFKDPKGMFDVVDRNEWQKDEIKNPIKDEPLKKAVEAMMRGSGKSVQDEAWEKSGFKDLPLRKDQKLAGDLKNKINEKLKSLNSGDGAYDNLLQSALNPAKAREEQISKVILAARSEMQEVYIAKFKEEVKKIENKLDEVKTDSSFIDEAKKSVEEAKKGNQDKAQLEVSALKGKKVADIAKRIEELEKQMGNQVDIDSSLNLAKTQVEQRQAEIKNQQDSYKAISSSDPKDFNAFKNLVGKGFDEEAVNKAIESAKETLRAAQKKVQENCDNQIKADENNAQLAALRELKFNKVKEEAKQEVEERAKNIEQTKATLEEKKEGLLKILEKRTSDPKKNETEIELPKSNFKSANPLSKKTLLKELSNFTNSRDSSSKSLEQVTGKISELIKSSKKLAEDQKEEGGFSLAFNTVKTASEGVFSLLSKITATNVNDLSPANLYSDAEKVIDETLQAARGKDKLDYSKLLAQVTDNIAQLSRLQEQEIELTKQLLQQNSNIEAAVKESKKLDDLIEKQTKSLTNRIEEIADKQKQIEDASSQAKKAIEPDKQKGISLTPNKSSEVSVVPEGITNDALQEAVERLGKDKSDKEEALKALEKQRGELKKSIEKNVSELKEQNEDLDKKQTLANAHLTPLGETAYEGDWETKESAFGKVNQETKPNSKQIGDLVNELSDEKGLIKQLQNLDNNISKAKEGLEKTSLELQQYEAKQGQQNKEIGNQVYILQQVAEKLIAQKGEFEKNYDEGSKKVETARSNANISKEKLPSEIEGIKSSLADKLNKELNQEALKQQSEEAQKNKEAAEKDAVEAAKELGYAQEAYNSVEKEILDAIAKSGVDLGKVQEALQGLEKDTAKPLDSKALEALKDLPLDEKTKQDLINKFNDAAQKLADAIEIDANKTAELDKANATVEVYQAAVGALDGKIGNQKQALDKRKVNLEDQLSKISEALSKNPETYEVKKLEGSPELSGFDNKAIQEASNTAKTNKDTKEKALNKANEEVGLAQNQFSTIKDELTKLSATIKDEKLGKVIAEALSKIEKGEAINGSWGGDDGKGGEGAFGEVNEKSFSEVKAIESQLEAYKNALDELNNAKEAQATAQGEFDKASKDLDKINEALGQQEGKSKEQVDSLGKLLEGLKAEKDAIDQGFSKGDEIKKEAQQKEKTEVKPADLSSLKNIKDKSILEKEKTEATNKAKEALQKAVEAEQKLSAAKKAFEDAEKALTDSKTSVGDDSSGKIKNVTDALKSAKEKPLEANELGEIESKNAVALDVESKVTQYLETLNKLLEAEAQKDLADQEKVSADATKQAYEQAAEELGNNSKEQLTALQERQGQLNEQNTKVADTLVKEAKNEDGKQHPSINAQGSNIQDQLNDARNKLEAAKLKLEETKVAQEGAQTNVDQSTEKLTKAKTFLEGSIKKAGEAITHVSDGSVFAGGNELGDEKATESELENVSANWLGSDGKSSEMRDCEFSQIGKNIRVVDDKALESLINNHVAAVEALSLANQNKNDAQKDLEALEKLVNDLTKENSDELKKEIKAKKTEVENSVIKVEAPKTLEEPKVGSAPVSGIEAHFVKLKELEKSKSGIETDLQNSKTALKNVQTEAKNKFDGVVYSDKKDGNQQSLLRSKIGNKNENQEVTISKIIEDFKVVNKSLVESADAILTSLKPDNADQEYQDFSGLYANHSSLKQSLEESATKEVDLESKIAQQNSDLNQNETDKTQVSKNLKALQSEATNTAIKKLAEESGLGTQAIEAALAVIEKDKAEGVLSSLQEVDLTTENFSDNLEALSAQLAQIDKEIKTKEASNAQQIGVKNKTEEEFEKAKNLVESDIKRDEENQVKAEVLKTKLDKEGKEKYLEEIKSEKTPFGSSSEEVLNQNQPHRNDLDSKSLEYAKAIELAKSSEAELNKLKTKSAAIKSKIDEVKRGSEELNNEIKKFVELLSGLDGKGQDPNALKAGQEAISKYLKDKNENKPNVYEEIQKQIADQKINMQGRERADVKLLMDMMKHVDESTLSTEEKKAAKTSLINSHDQAAKSVKPDSKDPKSEMSFNFLNNVASNFDKVLGVNEELKKKIGNEAVGFMKNINASEGQKQQDSRTFRKTTSGNEVDGWALFVDILAMAAVIAVAAALAPYGGLFLAIAMLWVMDDLELLAPPFRKVDKEVTQTRGGQEMIKEIEGAIMKGDLEALKKAIKDNLIDPEKLKEMGVNLKEVGIKQENPPQVEEPKAKEGDKENKLYKPIENAVAEILNNLMTDKNESNENRENKVPEEVKLEEIKLEVEVFDSGEKEIENVEKTLIEALQNNGSNAKETENVTNENHQGADPHNKNNNEGQGM